MGLRGHRVVHGEDLLTHFEGGTSHTWLLVSFGIRQAEHPQLFQDLLIHLSPLALCARASLGNQDSADGCCVVLDGDFLRLGALILHGALALRHGLLLKHSQIITARCSFIVP